MRNCEEAILKVGLPFIVTYKYLRLWRYYYYFLFVLTTYLISSLFNDYRGFVFVIIAMIIGFIIFMNLDSYVSNDKSVFIELYEDRIIIPAYRTKNEYTYDEIKDFWFKEVGVAPNHGFNISGGEDIIVLITDYKDYYYNSSDFDPVELRKMYNIINQKSKLYTPSEITKTYL